MSEMTLEVLNLYEVSDEIVGGTVRSIHKDSLELIRHCFSEGLKVEAKEVILKYQDVLQRLVDSGKTVVSIVLEDDRFLLAELNHKYDGESYFVEEVVEEDGVNYAKIIRLEDLIEKYSNIIVDTE